MCHYTKALALLFGQYWPNFATFQSPIKISKVEFASKFAKIHRLQAYILAKSGPFLPLFNLQSKSVKLNFGQNFPKYLDYRFTFLAKSGPFLPLFNLQSKSVKLNLVNICQNTKAIGLHFGQKKPIFATFQSPIKISKIEFWSKFAKIPKLQVYILAKSGPFQPLFNLQSKSVMLNFCQNLPKYQGYRLTFWPKVAFFCHFSISNQNQ